MTPSLLTPQRQPLFNKLAHQIKSPLAISLAIATATGCGLFVPAGSTLLLPVATLYLTLMKMVLLPFVLSGIMGGMATLQNTGQGVGRLFKMLAVFLLLILASALVAALATTLLPPTGTMNDAKMRDFGRLLNQQDAAMSGEIEMVVGAGPQPGQATHPAASQSLLEKIIPGNIFAALYSGDTLKVLVFALIFGWALSRVEGEPRPLTQVLKALELGCMTLMGWFNLMLPLALFAMTYHLVASTGVEVFWLMSSFLLTLGCAGLGFALLATGILFFTLDRSWSATLQVVRTPLIMAIGTQNAMLTIPLALNNFARPDIRVANADVIYPLGLSLCRFGANIFYVVGTVFVAQVYAHDIGSIDWLRIIGFSMLAGLASSGASGLLVVSMLALVCTPLHLPVEAALVLFVAVEPISDALRTAMNVAGNLATTAVSGRAVAQQLARGKPA